MTERDNRNRAGTLWSWVPAMLLGSMLVGLGSMAYIAIDDPSFALEPNYYDKAVHWDRSQAQARDSDALGLRLAVRQPLATSVAGEVDVEVSVLDRQNAPLQGAAVSLEAFPNAYAARIQQVSLHETAPGVYRARLGRGVPGLWELRFSVVKGTANFLQVVRADVAKGDAA